MKLASVGLEFLSFNAILIFAVHGFGRHDVLREKKEEKRETGEGGEKDGKKKVDVERGSRRSKPTQAAVPAGWERDVTCAVYTRGAVQKQQQQQEVAQSRENR